MSETEKIRELFMQYTSNNTSPLTETRQKQIIIKMGYYPFDAPIVNSFDELIDLLKDKKKFDVNELKTNIKNSFGSQEVSKEILLSKLSFSGILNEKEEQEFNKMFPETINLDMLIDQITETNS